MSGLHFINSLSELCHGTPNFQDTLHGSLSPPLHLSTCWLPACPSHVHHGPGPHFQANAICYHRRHFQANSFRPWLLALTASHMWRCATFKHDSTYALLAKHARRCVSVQGFVRIYCGTDRRQRLHLPLLDGY